MFFLVFVVALPDRIFPLMYVSIIYLSLALIFIVYRLPDALKVRNIGYYQFVGLFLLVAGLDFFELYYEGVDVNYRYYFSHINHYIQFFIIYIFFITALLLVGVRIIAYSGKLSIISAFSILINIIAIYGDTGELKYTKFDINYASFLIFSLLYLRYSVSSRLIKAVLVVATLLFAILLSGRASFVLITMVWAFYIYYDLSRYVLYAAVLTVLLVTTVSPFFISEASLDKLYELDHNSGIRVEFIRSAGELIKEAPLFGDGFNTPYRLTDYDYLRPHVLLTGYEETEIVSNHNSLIDTVLRIGLVPAVFLFYVLYFRRIRYQNLFVRGFLLLGLSIGLTVDAWFENQVQMVAFAFWSSLVFAFARLRLPRRR